MPTSNSNGSGKSTPHRAAFSARWGGLTDNPSDRMPAIAPSRLTEDQVFARNFDYDQPVKVFNRKGSRDLSASLSAKEG